MPIAPVDNNAGAKSGVAFLVSSGIVYEIIAAACSSPQTAEINADTRAKTLMKWVYIGMAQSAVFIGIAATLDRKHTKPIVAGGVLAGSIMYASYYHARKSGLANPGPSTESGNNDGSQGAVWPTMNRGLGMAA